MTSVSRFMIGVDVECTDGICGEVSRVVVDPIARAATYLLVEPKHRRGLGRLVPLELVDSTGRQVRLNCTRAAFENLDRGEVTHPLSGNSANADYGPGHAVCWPYFSLGVGGGVVGFGTENVPQLVTDDKIPFGEVAIRGGERVHAVDGDIGRVQGLLVDLADRHVVRVLIAERHLSGRRQEVAIPIDCVATVEHGIRLTITKRDVRGLPRGAAVEELPGSSQARTSREAFATVPFRPSGGSSAVGTHRRAARSRHRGFSARRQCPSRDA